MSSPQNPLDLVYSPQQAFDIGTRYLDERRKGTTQLIPLGIPELDTPDTDGNFFLPMAPGELITITGRPGAGKTGFMLAVARKRAKWLKESGHHDRIVVYVTIEQSVEELNTFQVAANARELGSTIDVTRMASGNISDQEWDDIMLAGLRRVELPLWGIGHSMARRKKRVQMTVPSITEGLRAIETWHDGKVKGLEIDMVFVDYLQRIKFDGHTESKTIGVSDNLDRLKDGAGELGTVMVVGVQAKREVDSYPLPIPGLDDGQWTSNIEQTSDGNLSVVRPSKYRRAGEFFGSVLVEGHSQMLVTVNKRKLGPDNFSKWIKFIPEYNQLDHLEMKHFDPNLDDDDGDKRPSKGQVAKGKRSSPAPARLLSAPEQDDLD